MFSLSGLIGPLGTVLFAFSVSVVPQRLSTKLNSGIDGSWQINRRLSTNGRSELPGKVDVDFNESQASDKWSLVESDYRKIELLAATEVLEIVSTDSEVTINALGDTSVVLTRTLPTDGTSVTQTISPGWRGLCKAEWKDGSLIVTSRTTNEVQLTETFELHPQTDQLFVTITFEGSGLGAPITVERLYDRSQK